MLKKIQKNWLKILISSFVFVCFFLFFFLRNHYYVPADLVINANFPTNAETVLSWDSGRGFNRNEVLPITLNAEDTQSTSKTINLPQLGLKQIKLQRKNTEDNIQIDSLIIKFSNKEETLSFTKDNDNLFLAQIDPKSLQKNHPVLILVQILLALFLAWLAFEFLGLKTRYRRKNWAALFKYIFLEEKHWVFWLMFLGALIVFSFWLLGQWPGAVSPDSLYQLFQTKTLILEDAHPYLHTFYMLFLMQFYDSFGSIAIFQILATAALGSYVFYFVNKNGLRWFLVLPFYLGFIFSIPIGLFNVVIWKDVPFSVLVAFWGFYLFYLGFQKSLGAPVKLSLKKIIVLSFLFILMTLIRHNGPLYLIVLPLIILWGNLMAHKDFLKFILISLVLFVSFNYLVPYVLKVTKWSSKVTSISWKINPMADVYLSQGYITDDPAYDKQIIEKIIKIDDMKKNYNPNYGGNLILGTQFDNLKDEDIKAFNHLFYIRMLENLPTFIGERTHLFIALLSCRTVTWTNEFYFDTYKSYVYLWRSGTSLYMQYQPIKSFSDFQIKIIGVLEKVKPIVFDLIYPTLFLLVVLGLYKWLPISSRANFLLVSQLPVWFIFVISPDFRYLYSIYLYYFFAFPLLLLEIFHNRQKNPKSLINKKIIFNFLIIFLIIVFLIPYICGGIITYFIAGSLIKQYFSILI